MYNLLGMQKIATSAYHPNGNGGVERVYHTMSQMLAMVVNEMQDDGDVHVPYVEFAYTNSASAATAWARIEVHMNRHCLLYTSPSPRDATLSRMPSSA